MTDYGSPMQSISSASADLTDFENNYNKLRKNLEKTSKNLKMFQKSVSGIIVVTTNFL